VVDRVDIGIIGEDIAEGYLRASGYEIIGRNLRFGHLEIDILARKARCLAFVEVKTRRGDCFGTAVEAISKEKLRRLLRCAEIYIMKRYSENTSVEYRIDVVAIDIQAEKGRLVLRHLIGVI